MYQSQELSENKINEHNMLLTFPNIESIDRLVDDKESPLLFQPSLLFVCIRFYYELWV